MPGAHQVCSTLLSTILDNGRRFIKYKILEYTFGKIEYEAHSVFRVLWTKRNLYSLNILHTYIHTYTYKHNWSLQAFSQDYSLTSYTTHVVCLNFIT